MADKFTNLAAGLDSPAANAFAVTPGSPLPQAARALYVGTGGSVAVTTVGGDSVTFANVQDGAILPVRCSAVGAATTATDVVGLA